LCFANHSAIGLSLNEPVNPYSICIFLKVSAFVTISIIPEIIIDIIMK